MNIEQPQNPKQTASLDPLTDRRAGSSRPLEQRSLNELTFPDLARNPATTKSSKAEVNKLHRDVITGADLRLSGMSPLRKIFYRAKELYFCPNRLESQKLYKALGVVLFKNLLMSTIGRSGVFQPSKKKLGTNYHLSDGSIKDLLRFDTMTRLNEGIHLVGIIQNINSIFQANPINWLHIGYLAINTYCVMLQRYNRIRLHQAQRNKYFDDLVDYTTDKPA